MGQKKKPLASRSKQALPSSSSPATAEAEVKPSEVSASTFNEEPAAHPEPSDSAAHPEPSDLAAIKLECEKALASLQRGSYNKAIRLMKESCSRHQDSALIHRVQGTVCVKVASVYEDPATKQRYLRSAIESARKAVELSPNSIEFGHFYANLLYEAANDGREYEEVVQECQRALSIENPIDPAKDSLQVETQQKILTPDARVANVQEELRSLIQKSNLGSLSTLMKHLGNGEDNFRFIPVRRMVEDPIESSLIQSRRPNEIKKATKTLEERRKEIEVRVAAARLLQQKSDSSSSDIVNNKGLDPALGVGQRSGERKRHGNARKNDSTGERRDRVRLYWESTSKEMKQELLRVKVSDLKSHFSSSKDGQANEIINEALSFYEANKTWRFWVCYECSEKFMDCEAHMQHIVKEHIGNVLPKMQMVLPQSLNSERIEMLLSSPWKPLDLPAAVKLLCSQKKIQNTEYNDFHTGDNMEDGDDCFQDAWNDTSPEKENLGDACNGCDENESGEGKMSNPFHLPDGWPISDDPERTKLLAKIRAAFELLIRHNNLATSHHDKVIQFTMDEFRNLPSGSQFLNRCLGQSPICICFLGAIQLRKILKFLQDLSQACGLSRFSEPSNLNDEVIGGQSVEVTEEIRLDGEDSCLLLDENLLGTECIQEKYMGSTLNNRAEASSGDIANGNNVSSGEDGFLSWIFTGPSSEEQIVLWMGTKEKKTNRGLEIMQILEKEFCRLQNLYERKCEHLSYEEALQTVADLCLEEGRKRETLAEFTHESYEAVLRRRREELIESEHDLMFVSSRFELEAITNVLKDADSLNHNQFGYEESYACTSSQQRDLESGEEADEWGMRNSFREADGFIETAIQKQKENLSAELNRIDAKMMRSVTEVQQLEIKLGPASFNDYQIVLLPLVKSYTRAHLEALADKDATEKSDAASEALLVELALNSKKEARGRNDNPKHTHEKSKDKKKNKETKKPKDLKASFGNGHRFNVDSFEHSLPTVASFGDPSEADIVPEAVEALKEEEEEHRRRVELELEEIKLEKTLEYQRRIENEAKEKHIAEQQKKYSSLVPMNVADEVYDVCRDSLVDDLYLQEQEKFDQENRDQRNGLPHDLEGIRVNTNGGFPSTNHCVISDAATVQDVKSQKVANGATPDGVFQSDQRTGRRGRRQKTSNKLAGPSESLNSESHRSGSDKERQSESLHSNGDAGTKTLRQLQAEEDEEEKFQADLKKAVRQSLDAYQGGSKMTSHLRTPLEVNSDGVSDVTKESQSSTEVGTFGTGLQNEIGEYNCFLNVIIQSLWNLKMFRAEFLRSSTLEHHHVGDPCVVCSLYDVFTALNAASREIQKEPVAPSSLRIALSNFYPDSSFFQEAQMNDASEVLGVIFDCLHRSFSQSSSVSDTESSESKCAGSWDCANCTCIAHSLFGMNIFEQLNCYSCGLESRHLKYTSSFHNINASALRTMKVACPDNSFDDLLNLVVMNDQLACDPEAGGCGKLNHIRHILTTPPHVFTTVLGWQNTCERVEDIAATLAALNTEIDISIMYRGLDPKSMYSLASVVCYYGQHYHCFAYSHEHDRWIMFDDKTVKVVGSWSNVLSMCEKGRLQPQVLLYEKQS